MLTDISIINSKEGAFVPKHQSIRMTAIQLGAALAVSAWASAAKAQLVVPLLPVNGSDTSTAQSIDSNGVVVGFSSGANDRPTVWRPLNAYAPEALPAIDGGASGAANSIGSGGAIAGYWQPADLSTATAVVWTPSTASYSVTSLPSVTGAALTNAYAVNGGGSVAGYAADVNGNTAPVVWTPGSTGYTATVLPPLSGQTQGAATALDQSGNVAGYTLGNAGLQAAVWTLSGGTYTQHVVIANDTAEVTSMSADGTGAGVYAGNQPLVMVNFQGDYYAINLDFPFGATDGASDAVNNSDVIVGYVKDPTTTKLGKQAAIWLPTDTDWQYLNLDQWLEQTDPLLASHWTLQEATAINDNGLVAGYGLFDPDGAGPLPATQEGFLLDASSLVPEPGCATLAGLVCLPLLMRRNKTKSYCHR